MKFNKLVLLFLLFFGLQANAQQVFPTLKPISEYPAELLKTDEFGIKYYYDQSQKARIYEINGENVVVMDELILRNNPKFNNQLDQNYYYFLICLLHISYIEIYLYKAIQLVLIHLE